MTDLKLKVGKGSFEGREYTYLYVLLDVNGELVEIRLKANSKLESDLLKRELEKNNY